MRVKPINNFPPGRKCILCSSDEVEACLGSIYKLKTICVHYFCLLLSNGIKQNGRDNQGILGFLSNDIKDEAKRGETEVCSYCKKKGATIVCSHRSCTIKFHLPCGTKKGSMHLFFGLFPSYCGRHRKNQEIPPQEVKKLKLTKPDCPICSENINLNDKTSFIWPSCCKSIPIHRICIQKYANEAGLYHFKCSLCQDRDHFKKLCQDLGIFIPQRDASWELEPRAFEDLQQVYYCNAEVCKCPKGRYHNHSKTKWASIKCSFCHFSGTHLECSPYKISNPDSWICNLCEDISERFKSSTNPENEEVQIVKKTREPLPSTTLVKNSESILLNGESSSQAGSSMNDSSHLFPRVVLSQFDISTDLSKPGPSNLFLNSPASSSENSTRPPSPDSSPVSPSAIEKPPEEASSKTNDKETVIDEASCSKNDTVGAINDEVINLDSDEDPISTFETLSTKEEAFAYNFDGTKEPISTFETLSTKEEPFAHYFDGTKEPISTFEALSTKEEAFAHNFDGTKETFLVYRSEIIVSSESDGDVEIVETSLPLKTNRKKKKFFKNSRSKAPPKKAASPISSDSDEVAIVGFSLKDLESTSIRKEPLRNNESIAENLNHYDKISSNKLVKPSSVKVVRRLHGSVPDEASMSYEKFLQGMACQNQKSKPSAAIKPMCFEADEKSRPSPEPVQKKAKIDNQDGSRSAKVFHSCCFLKKIEQPRIKVYFAEMESRLDYWQDCRQYTMTSETAKIFAKYINSIVRGSSIMVIYDTQGKKYCQLLSQNYNKLPIIYDKKPVTFDSKIFEFLRNHSPSTVFLIAADISNVSDDYIDLVEAFNERFNFKIVLTTLPKIEKTAKINFKHRLTNNFNRYMVEMCEKNSIDIWDLNKIDFLKLDEIA